jgi:hypothetical protein
MDSEAKIIIAFLFNRSGKVGLKDSELYLPLSMELGWFSTKEAQDFVKYAVKHELLVKKDGILHPTFPLETITIPMGFTPTKKVVHDNGDLRKEKNIVDDIVLRISEKTSRDQQEILSEIHQVEHDKNILPEVAALYVARTYGLDVADCFDAVEHSFFK